ncbi:hypothetical protein HPK19_04690 [Arthrobacter citreus]|nr:hypothetical protein HPK19_04690 [Arthrobacter citreus]
MRVQPLDIGKLRDKYATDLTLLSESVGVFSGLTGTAMLDCFTKIERAIDADEYDAMDLVRELYVNIEFFLDRPALYDWLVEESLAVIDDEEEAKAHYETIKHLI